MISVTEDDTNKILTILGQAQTGVRNIHGRTSDLEQEEILGKILENLAWMQGFMEGACAQAAPVATAGWGGKKDPW